MSITDKRKLVLVFMVSALLCILAFKAIGQDTIGVPVNINGLKRLPQIDPDPSTLKLIWTDIKKYKPYGQGRVINFTLSTLSGIAWGTHEAIYADATILEKRFGFSKYSWGGSNAWESKYPGGKYEEGEHPILWKDKTNLFREAKKSTAFLGRYGAIVVAINISRKEKVHWLDYVINSALYTGSALVTYNYLR